MKKGVYLTQKYWPDCKREADLKFVFYTLEAAKKYRNDENAKLPSCIGSLCYYNIRFVPFKKKDD